jgi:surface antigen
MTQRLHSRLALARIATLVALGAAATAAPAAAQYRDVFGSMRPGPGDQQMVRTRVQDLLDGPASPRTLDWNNPRSGNSGAVILQMEFTRRDQQCRQIEYRIIHRSQADPEVAVLVWCKQASGRWAIAG